MNYFKVRTIRLGYIFISAAFSAILFNFSPASVFINDNVVSPVLSSRRVRDAGQSKLEEAIYAIEEWKRAGSELEGIKEVITQLYFNYNLADLSVSQKTEFALNAFDHDDYPSVHEALQFISDKYELQNMHSTFLSSQKQYTIEKYIQVIKNIFDFDEITRANLEFTIGLISGFLPEEVSAEIIPNYDIGEFVNAEPLAGGFFNKPMCIETTEGKYILRESRVHNTPESIDYEYSVIEELKSKGFPAPEMLLTKDGLKYVEFKGRLFTIYRYTDGYELSWREEISDNMIINIAQTLAKYHQIMEGFIPDGNIDEHTIIETQRFYKEFEQVRERITALPPELRNEAENFLLESYDSIIEQIGILEKNLPVSIYESLPNLVIHGDYARKNIKLDGNEIVAVFDWDRMRHEARVYDVVWSMISFGDGHITDPFSINNEKVKLFLKAYNEVNPLTEQEIRIIPEIYRAILIEFFSWTNRPDKQLSMQKPESLDFWKGIAIAISNIDNVNWEEFFRSLGI